MKYKQLAASGIAVSEIGLGGNTFGRECDRTTSVAIVKAALESGITLFDTADSYSDGLSEEFIGAALVGHRQNVVLATKTGWPRFDGDQGALGSKQLLDHLDSSLRRLGTDYIDLYYLHHPDPATPLEETMAAMDQALRSGRVRYFGCSNFPAPMLLEMNDIAEATSFPLPIVTQSQYNLVSREIEHDLLPTCDRLGMGLIVYRALAGGFLTGKYRRGAPIEAGWRGHENAIWQGRWLSTANFDVLEACERIAASAGRSLTSVALGWLLSSRATSILVGASSAAQVPFAVKEAIPLRPDLTRALDACTRLASAPIPTTSERGRIGKGSKDG